jgi:hypothetical protein
LAKEYKMYLRNIVAQLCAIVLISNGCTAGDAGKPTMASPYTGLQIQNFETRSMGGPVEVFKFGVYYPHGNASPQPKVVVPTAVYDNYGHMIKPNKSPIFVDHNSVKVLCTGAVEGTFMGTYYPHPYIDEGGGETWDVRVTGTMQTHRAGTIYVNVFDDAGNLVASSTENVDAHVNVVKGE